MSMFIETERYDIYAESAWEVAAKYPDSIEKPYTYTDVVYDFEN